MHALRRTGQPATMSRLMDRIRAWLHTRRWSERRTAEGEVERDRHQVTGRPTSGADGPEPGTTSTRPNDTYVGRISGDDAGQ